MRFTFSVSDVSRAYLPPTVSYLKCYACENYFVVVSASIMQVCSQS